MRNGHSWRLLIIAVAVVARPPARAVAAPAEPNTLRIATVAPEGTSWAREINAFTRDAEAVTHGLVHIKVYFGGIAGTEEQVLERIRREQLDGVLGTQVCSRLSPSLRVGRIVGVFRSRQENAYVLSRLRARVDAEFLRQGFINLGEAGLGPEVLFTRAPLPTLKAMRELRWWVWQSDDELPPQMRALGLNVVLTPLETAGRSFDEGRFDGFIAIPTAAMAFQWTLQTRYVTALRVTFRSGCLIVATRAFDALPFDAQQGVRAVVGKLDQRIEDQGAREDELLLGGLLARQGLSAMHPSDALRTEFFEAARASKAPVQIVPDDVLQLVYGWLADYRALHQ
jgi:TRAP-type C4-dicarboxylate transport system substrate-binding protein